MMNMEVMSSHSETDDPNGEGVWSPEIERAFQEALKIYHPCGRRKHILPEEGGGKMYGRNELIARYIEQKTGHKRTRKQVSSHIQVLSRREARSKASSRGGDTDSVSPASSITASSLGAADRIPSRPDSATSGYNNNNNSSNINLNLNLNNNNAANSTVTPMQLSNVHHLNQHHHHHHHHQHHLDQIAASAAGLNVQDFWEDRPIMTSKIRLVEFSAFIEQRKLLPNGNNNLLMGGAPPADLYAQQQQQQQQQLQQPAGGRYNGHHHHQVNNLALQQGLSPMNNPPGGEPYSGFHRHSYVKIDYRQPSERVAQKMERIDIREIQDKFPDIGGPDGLFQRGSPDSFFLVKFWADLDFDPEQLLFEDQNSYFGFSSHFETVIPYKDITCSTRACSYGHQVVEKVEIVYGSYNSSNNTYSYAINRSPMCEFMIQFIRKLRQLPELPLMNRILENFTVLQLVTSESTSEILLCIAYVFEISSLRQMNNHQRGSHYHVYQLTKD